MTYKDFSTPPQSLIQLVSGAETLRTAEQIAMDHKSTDIYTAQTGSKKQSAINAHCFFLKSY